VGGIKVNLAAINRTIRVMCSEVGSLGNSVPDWRSLSEEVLLYEVTVCVFGSQMLFEVAVAAADRIKELGLLRARQIMRRRQEYEACLAAALSKPLSVEINGVRRQMLPRFRNRLAVLLASTVEAIHGHGSSLQGILRSAKSAQHARELLVAAVSGFGPKQTSLFLRRIGYCSELAVLDTHVLDYLRMACGIRPKPGALSRLSSYEYVENEFRRVAKEFGYAVGCVDLAMWVTMRVAKREAMV
jgi:N-glycosylase/DNA lyase